MIILLSTGRDINCLKLSHVLSRRKKKHIILDPSNSKSSYAFETLINDNNIKIKIYSKSYCFDITEVSAVWCRTHPLGAFDATKEQTWRNLTRAEYSASYSFIWSMLSDIKWVNPYFALSTPNRMYQKMKAKQIGLSIPNSILSDDLKNIIRFSDSTGDLIIKKISQGNEKNSGPYFFMTSLIDKSILRKINKINSPVLLQEKVKRLYDIRATIINDIIFCGAIYPKDKSTHDVDSRKWLHEGSRYAHYDMPEHEKEKIINLNKSLGYRYSAMDFIRSKDGNLVFLESNPGGQWRFLEHHIQAPITETIVDDLCEII